MRQPRRHCRVVFICAGNICRSVVALHAFRLALARRGVEGVASASFGLVAEDGDVPCEETLRAAAAAGLDLRSHVARRFDASLLGPDDEVIVMERSQRDFLLRVAGVPVVLLGSLAPGPSEDIADPEHGDDAVFDACVARIVACAEALAGQWTDGGSGLP